MAVLKYRDPVTGEWKQDIHVISNVSSVNGQIGVITLDADDVGALDKDLTATKTDIQYLAENKAPIHINRNGSMTQNDFFNLQAGVYVLDNNSPQFSDASGNTIQIPKNDLITVSKTPNDTVIINGTNILTKIVATDSINIDTMTPYKDFDEHAWNPSIHIVPIEDTITEQDLLDMPTGMYYTENEIRLTAFNTPDEYYFIVDHFLVWNYGDNNVFIYAIGKTSYMAAFSEDHSLSWISYTPYLDMIPSNVPDNILRDYILDIGSIGQFNYDTIITTVDGTEYDVSCQTFVVSTLYENDILMLDLGNLILYCNDSGEWAAQEVGGSGIIDLDTSEWDEVVEDKWHLLDVGIYKTNHDAYIYWDDGEGESDIIPANSIVVVSCENNDKIIEANGTTYNNFHDNYDQFIYWTKYSKVESSNLNNINEHIANRDNFQHVEIISGTVSSDTLKRSTIGLKKLNFGSSDLRLNATDSIRIAKGSLIYAEQEYISGTTYTYIFNLTEGYKLTIANNDTYWTKTDIAQSDIFVATYGTTSYSDILAAVNIDKHVQVNRIVSNVKYTYDFTCKQNNELLFGQAYGANLYYCKVNSSNIWSQGTVIVPNSSVVTQNTADITELKAKQTVVSDTAPSGASNVLWVDTDDDSSDDSNSVRYDIEQDLSTAEKTRARTNIGAASSDSVGALSEDVQELEETVAEKQNAPAVVGVSGQVLGLDANLVPIWLNLLGGIQVTDDGEGNIVISNITENADEEEF